MTDRGVGDGPALGASAALDAEWARERRLTRLTQVLLWASIAVAPVAGLLRDTAARDVVPFVLMGVGGLVSVVLSIQTRVYLDRRARAVRTLTQPHAPARALNLQERADAAAAAAEMAHTGTQFVVAAGVALALATFAYTWSRARGMDAVATGSGIVGLFALMMGGVAFALTRAGRRASTQVRDARRAGFVRGAYFSPRAGAAFIGGVRVRFAAGSAPPRPAPGQLVEAAVLPAYEDDPRPSTPRRVLAFRELGAGELRSTAADVASSRSTAATHWLPAMVGGGAGVVVLAGGLLLTTHAGNWDWRPHARLTVEPRAPASGSAARSADDLRSALVPDSLRGDSAFIASLDDDDDDDDRVCDSVAARPNAASYAAVRSACVNARIHARHPLRTRVDSARDSLRTAILGAVDDSLRADQDRAAGTPAAVPAGGPAGPGRPK